MPRSLWPGLSAAGGDLLAGLCEPCVVRAQGDGLICRSCAAMLGQVKPDTVSAWLTRDRARLARGEPLRLTVRYEGRKPMFVPKEIIELAWSLHERERGRDQLRMALAGGEAP